MVKIPICSKCNENQAIQMSSDGAPLCGDCGPAPRVLSAEEFEYLALMGRTQAGDLIVGEGGAERVLQRAKQLVLAPDDVLDVYVPGRLRCPKCKFDLTKATLFVQSGQIGASKKEVYQESEPCPNDGTLMDRVTWREEADSNREYATRLIDEIIQATGANSLPEALQAAAKAKEERGLFLEALVKYGGHDVECLVDGSKECSCGFSALLAGAGITVEYAESTGKSPAPDTLKLAWERFNEEERHAQVEVGPARKAFYAGAQSFVGIVSAAMEDEQDVDAWQRLEGAYEELAQVCEELKI